nr:hypothetical protein [Pseudomonadota bacterium]
MTAHHSTPSATKSSALARKRRALLVGCAAGAAAALLVRPQPVAAQAINATPTTFAGSVSYFRSTPGEERIVINQFGSRNSAIIDWNFGGTVAGTHNFLPEGNVATFTGNDGFAVLNRVFISVPIEFNGLLESIVNGDGPPGGTVIFTNAAGIIVGSTARFDVGNLVLSTLTVEPNRESGYGPDFDPQALSFVGGDANPNSAVVTQPGAQINAPSADSYVAMVAPRVVHGGSTRVNGSAAYVAGEDVDITINSGLFNIVVNTGSDNANPLTHTGSTGGPASTGAGDNHRIYMVAVPKNQAITALLSGSVGFDAATDVTVENGEIILSAGYNVSGNFVSTFNPSSQPASFQINQGTITSDLTGAAVTNMHAGGATGNLTFSGDVELYALGSARLFADSKRSVTVAGNASVLATRRVEDSSETQVTGGEALVRAAADGLVVISGDLTVDASASGYGDGYSASATGGTAGIAADGGTVTVSGDVDVISDGQGGRPYSPGTGEGTGGTASIVSSNNGSVVITGEAEVRASGSGGDASYSEPAGSGTGGNAGIRAEGGSIAITGQALVFANGTGGWGSYYGSADSAGAGYGGTARI